MNTVQRRLKNLDMKGLLDVEESLFDSREEDELALQASSAHQERMRNKVEPLRSNEQIEEMTIFGSILNG